MQTLETKRPAVSLAVRPPGPRESLFALRRLFQNPAVSLAKMAWSHGDISAFRFGTFNIIVVNHPDLVKALLETEEIESGRMKFTPRFKKRFGNGVLASTGEDRLRQRKVLWQCFSRERVQHYSTIVARHAGELSETWQEGEVADMLYQMSHLTSTVICDAMFSEDLDTSGKAILDSLHRAHAAFASMRPMAAIISSVLPFGTAHNQYLAEDQLDEKINAVIAARQGEGLKRSDILAALMAARYDDGSSMPAAIIRDNLVSLFWAPETASMTLAWLWYNLSQYPEIEARVVAEMRAAFEDRGPNFEDLEKLVYTRQVISETMRFYPPFWHVARRTVEGHDTLVEHQGVTYKLPKDSMIFACQYAMNRDPRYWENPETFEPDRWEAEKAKAVDRYVYFPFGLGPRRCMGDGFAWMQIQMILSTLLLKWQARVNEGAKVTMQGGITLQPAGLKMRLTRRK